MRAVKRKLFFAPRRPSSRLMIIISVRSSSFFGTPPTKISGYRRGEPKRLECKGAGGHISGEGLVCEISFKIALLGPAELERRNLYISI